MSSSTIKQPRFDVDADRLALIVTGDSLFTSQPLPATADLVIGRASDADVRVEHASVSRQHAILHVGSKLEIEDLGSANGTRVRGCTIAPHQRVEIAAGEVVDVGSVLLVVQPRPQPTSARRMWSHDYFEGRLEEECTRAARTGGRFVVIHVAAGVTADNGLRDAILAGVRPDDVVGTYAPNSYEILMLDVDPADAERVARQLVATAARRGAPVRSGVAVYPRDGLGAHALLAHAMAEVTGTAGERSLRASLATSSAMQDLHRLAECVAAGAISVLVLGETGAGKEVLAETIHRMSPRRDAPFLRLNCAALSETLLESELFGHEKGAFTGAVHAKPGLLETADRGTVFLDEVGELPLTTQVKLLRVLEERQVLRVGGLKPRPIDVRFVAATNRDLEAEVARGAFRQDLFYRISAATLVIPPLRERVGEIAGLARAFVDGVARELDRPVPPLAPDALGMLEAYSWPGNIRELRNVMERAVLLCGVDRIEAEHLPTQKMRATLPPRRPPHAAVAAVADRPTSAPMPDSPIDHMPSVADRPLREVVREQVAAVEKQRILDALHRAAGNQTAAAQLLGMPRRTFVKRLRTYGIPRPRADR